MAMMHFGLASIAMLVPVCLSSPSFRGGQAPAPHEKTGPRQLFMYEATWMPPRPSDVSCLKEAPYGCYPLTEREACLGSRDGRARKAWHGLEIGGEPCVWCGGGQCHNNNTNKCEPYDFLYRGLGVGFKEYISTKNYAVSPGCQDGQIKPQSSEEPQTPVRGDSTGDVIAGPDPGTNGGGGATVGAGAPASEPKEDCWYACGQHGGFCDACGAGKACCRKGFGSDPDECLNALALTTDNQHECVTILSAIGDDLGASMGALPPPPGALDGTAAALPAAVASEPAATQGPLAGTTAALPAAVTSEPAATQGPLAGTTSALPAAVASEPAATQGPLAGETTALPTAVTSEPAATHGPLEGETTAAPAPVSSESAATEAPGTPPEGSAVADTTTALPAAIATEPAATPVPELPEESSTVAPPGDRDCWFACGGRAGECPSFCGQGYACCRDLLLTDPPECRGTTGFTTALHHQCVKSADGAVNAVPDVTTTAPFDIRSTKPAIPEYDAPARNASNGTHIAAAAGGQAWHGIPTWGVLIIATVILSSILLGLYMASGKKTAQKKKTKRSKRFPQQSREEKGVNGAAGSEPEMRTPLVSPQDQGDDIFDKLDANHDGVISLPEWEAGLTTSRTFTACVPVITRQYPSALVAPVLIMPPVQGAAIHVASTVRPLQGPAGQFNFPGRPQLAVPQQQ